MWRLTANLLKRHREFVNIIDIRFPGCMYCTQVIEINIHKKQDCFICPDLSILCVEIYSVLSEVHFLCQINNIPAEDIWDGM
jgi:hypothetical protein